MPSYELSLFFLTTQRTNFCDGLFRNGITFLVTASLFTTEHSPPTALSPADARIVRRASRRDGNPLTREPAYALG